MQATPVGYILENVPPLGIVDPQVQADAQLVCRYLGKPVAVECSSPGVLCPSASMEVDESSECVRDFSSTPPTSSSSRQACRSHP